MRSFWRLSANVAGLLGIALGLLFIIPTTARADPDVKAYQIMFGSAPPTSGAEALNSVVGRADTVIQFLGCGQEREFVGGATLTTRSYNEDRAHFADAEDVSEGMLHEVLAKMIVYATWPRYASVAVVGGEVRCRQHVEFYQLQPKKNPSDPDAPDTTNLDWTAISQSIVGLFGGRCAGTVVGFVDQDSTGLVKVDYGLTRECLRSQINVYLKNAYVTGQAGSTGVPCFPSHLIRGTNGEWDVILKELTRIYIANLRMGDFAPLDDDVRTHIRNDLLTLDGGPGKDSYNIGECGDTQYDTGPPEDRADDQSWTQNALSDIGDALGWLLRWLALIAALALALAIAAAVLGALLGGLAGGVVAALAALGVVALTFGDISETENHRLMIESARYLNNQIILAEIDPGDSNAGRIVDDQTQVREWLLRRLAGIAAGDFIEFNARPYQRYSLSALRNLADLADDDSVRMAARNVLDLASAKFAAGSQQGRRLVPFRRRMEYLPKFIEQNGLDNGNVTHNGLFDIEQGADHQIAAMLLYAGQTQQTPGNKITPQSVDEMMLVAGSDYRPPAPVLDVAVNKALTPAGGVADTPIQQTFHHAGVEIYASTPGFLLTAGGIVTDPAYTFTIAGLSLGNKIGPIPLASNVDYGAAVPTTLMLAQGGDRSSLEAFLQVSGPRRNLDSDNGTYDHNLCVYHGFACGLDLYTPPDMDACFVPGPAGTPDQWRFFDSQACPAYGGPPRVMIARYLENCGSDRTGECLFNLGLFEAISNPTIDFATFQTRTLQNNPNTGGWLGLIGGGVLGSNRTVLSGTYVNLFGEKIGFNTSGHQLDSSQTGIASLDGGTMPKLENWAGASGDLMNLDGGPARYKFVNPMTGHGFSVDMSDWNVPKRSDF